MKDHHKISFLINRKTDYVNGFFFFIIGYYPLFCNEPSARFYNLMIKRFNSDTYILKQDFKKSQIQKRESEL